MSLSEDQFTGIHEFVAAKGHPNIQATHKTTFEITKEKHLTKQGDCIIAVGSTKSALDFCQEFKEAAKTEGARITIIIEVGEYREVVLAQGSTKLSFVHPTDMVVRKSSYVCGRTVAVKADKAARDFSRTLVRKMLNPNQQVKIQFTVEK